MTRTKTGAVLPPQDLHAVEPIMEKYAQDDARVRQINAEMDSEFAVIRARHAAELQTITERMTKSFNQARMNFETNRDHFFGKKKSFDTAQGTVGYRTGTPKTTPRKGFTWASILEMFRMKAPEYIKIKEEPNKEMMLMNREIDEQKLLIYTCGVEIVQDETFFIELKKEGGDAQLN